ncbi:hypothetical protein IQ247_05660 [Plectonema cf. radiosum LEGE 06105]|uniref:Uncharacterized protein n=1 Tax=Plectonema cf. radiosum LEGE 06105 TaxID=945769 RepID=A0A8J7FDD8_9CYAN|nr:hypothetical protein [Plectonema radiosum]MBE9212201.1 hypothetical protein [Plectonema cf. radiosum LEGE 06105]
MKNLLFLICSTAALITISAAFVGNFMNNHQSTVAQSDINNMNSNSSTSTTFTSNSSGYQRGKVNLSNANLSQPHILKIETSATKLNGKIVVNGKVVKNLNNKTTEIDLSRYLSVGEHKIEISANYSPAMSPITVQLNAPNSNVTQQTSGNGILNYQLDISVQ